jgi:hypothetical protein
MRPEPMAQLRAVLLLLLAARTAAHGAGGWEVLAQCGGWVSLNNQYQARGRPLASRATPTACAFGACAVCVSCVRLRQNRRRARLRVLPLRAAPAAKQCACAATHPALLCAGTAHCVGRENGL